MNIEIKKTIINRAAAPPLIVLTEKSDDPQSLQSFITYVLDGGRFRLDVRRASCEATALHDHSVLVREWSNPRGPTL